MVKHRLPLTYADDMYARVMLEPEEERARMYVDMLYCFSVFASLHSLACALSCSASVGMVAECQIGPLHDRHASSQRCGGYVMPTYCGGTMQS